MKQVSTILFCFATIAPTFAQTEGDQFFAEGDVHEIHFQFSQPSYWDSLVANKPSETYMKCDVTVDGTPYPDAGVRFKGNSSYGNPSMKKPFKIDFEEFVDDQAHDGLKQLSLNNGFKDPTFLREKLALDFMNQHGIAAPRATFARLYLNGEFWGLYPVVEDIGKTFLKQRFDNNDGNLFKGDPHGTLQWKGDQQNNYIGDYELKTNEDLNDWSDLIALLDALNNSAAAELHTALADRLNLDSWYGYWAAHSLFVNLDSYVGSGHNYYLYRNEDTDQFEFIAWDENEAFGNFKMGLSEQQLLNLPFTHIPQPFDQRPLMNRLLQNADMKQAYAYRYCELLQDFSNEALDARIDSLADLIRPHVYEDTKKFYPNNVFEQNLGEQVTTQGGPQGSYIIAGLKPFINGRREALLAQLAVYGCSASAVETTGVEDELLAFPNPTSGHFFIKNSGEAIVRLHLTDLNGRLAKTWDGLPTNGEMECSAAGLPAGVYFLVAEGINGRKFKKLFKF